MLFLLLVDVVSSHVDLASLAELRDEETVLSLRVEGFLCSLSIRNAYEREREDEVSTGQSLTR